MCACMCLSRTMRDNETRVMLAEQGLHLVNPSSSMELEQGELPEASLYIMVGKTVHPILMASIQI